MTHLIAKMIMDWGLTNAETADFMASFAIILSCLFVALPFYYAIRFVILKSAKTIAAKTSTDLDDIVIASGFFKYIALLFPGYFVYSLCENLVGSQYFLGRFTILMAKLWLLLFIVFALNSLMDSLVQIYQKFNISKNLPIRTFIQVIKLLIILAGIIISISMLMGKSPAMIISGLGAMTAVLMLVFKDPIMGFVAGIQLSANDMLAVGDWLEMPKYNADGDVIDITLTTVKVQNWDKTITTIPTYALISDSFKNWRGMFDSGGRRIMRSLNFDMNSVVFLTPEDIKRLSKAQLISSYITNKITEIEEYNTKNKMDPSSPANGRKLTNLGTFRAYIVEYLKNHPGINQNMTAMVRQLQPTPEGIPLQIYAFTSTTVWVKYEGIQSDIFDHLIAVAGEFNLKIFQIPSGNDLQKITNN